MLYTQKEMKEYLKTIIHNNKTLIRNIALSMENDNKQHEKNVEFLAYATTLFKYHNCSWNESLTTGTQIKIQEDSSSGRYTV